VPERFPTTPLFLIVPEEVLDASAAFLACHNRSATARSSSTASRNLKVSKIKHLPAQYHYFLLLNAKVLLQPIDAGKTRIRRNISRNQSQRNQNQNMPERDVVSYCFLPIVKKLTGKPLSSRPFSTLPAAATRSCRNTSRKLKVSKIKIKTCPSGILLLLT
jgi:hypothetical protein